MKLTLMDEDYSKVISDYKFKVKDQKHDNEELRLKLKHCENRISQKDE